VAVSGGPDSVCLLDTLYRLRDPLGIDLVVAHFDHGLRPGEDESETQFVESLAQSLTLAFKTKRTESVLMAGASSLEERAREARYRFLEEVRNETRAQKIALGHNLNDQAETVLMRLLRGSGPSGLGGIPPQREDRVVRPLIELTRDEIQGYLAKRGLRYVSDPSNRDTTFLRNRIRLELIPQIRKYQPRIVEILGKTAGIMRTDEVWLEEEAGAWINDFAEKVAKGEVSIPLPRFRALPEALKGRVIRQVLRRAGGGLRRVGFRHVEAVNRLAVGERPQARVNLPNGVTASRVYDRLVFSRKDRRYQKGFCYFLDGPGEFHLESLNCTITFEEIGNWVPTDLRASPWVAFIDADSITYPLTVRNFMAGDRFVPLGMRGRRKVKDFFIDLKVPSEIRKSTPLLTCRDKLVWVCGLRIDDHFKVTPETKRVLKVSCNYSGVSSQNEKETGQRRDSRKGQDLIRQGKGIYA
jgi:tRNA(Ile)-lysidine synthase